MAIFNSYVSLPEGSCALRLRYCYGAVGLLISEEQNIMKKKMKKNHETKTWTNIIYRYRSPPGKSWEPSFDSFRHFPLAENEEMLRTISNAGRMSRLRAVRKLGFDCFPTGKCRAWLGGLQMRSGETRQQFMDRAAWRVWYLDLIVKMQHWPAWLSTHSWYARQFWFLRFPMISTGMLGFSYPGSRTQHCVGSWWQPSVEARRWPWWIFWRLAWEVCDLLQFRRRLCSRASNFSLMTLVVRVCFDLNTLVLASVFWIISLETHPVYYRVCDPFGQLIGL